MVLRNMDGTYKCPVCGKSFEREEMTFSRDCQGIPFRLMCWDCWDEIEETRGYDGQLYTHMDEVF